MRLNFKTIIVGGLVFYAAQWILGMTSGVVIHGGVLDSLYAATAEYWRPELMQDPPDMAALMPRWIATGLAAAFLFVGIYDNIRDTFDGSGPIKGLKFGFVLSLIYAATAAGWSGIFNLPDAIWAWWIVEGFFVYCIAAAAMGWYVGKYATD